jgi:hypothetical protein
MNFIVPLICFSAYFVALNVLHKIAHAIADHVAPIDVTQ